MKGKHKLVFDPKDINFSKAGVETWKIVKALLMSLFLSFGVAVVGYLFFAFFYSTPEEKQLIRENRMYEKVFPSIGPKEQLLKEGIASLQHKDSRIYEQVFHSSAPNVDPMSQLNFLFSSDTIPDTRMVSYTRDKSDSLLAKASEIDAAFAVIFRILSDTSAVIPPMMMPVEDVSYTQVGASIGKKMSPFLKAFVAHGGIDFIVLRGSEVKAPADGVVADAGNDKSDGRYVVLTHAGGYTTRYCHLESVDVKKGQNVSRGAVIGHVGMSGNSFAPHLHYEICRDSVIADPVNYLFASIPPMEYANVLYMAANTEQSMD